MIKKLILTAIALSLVLAPNWQPAQAGLWDETPFQNDDSQTSFKDFVLSFIKSDKPLIKKRFPTDPSITDYVQEDLSKLLQAYEVKAKYTVAVTGYSSEVWQTDSTPFITASNTHVRDGVIAANFLPFGTLIRIPELYGSKIFIVEDRMNSRYWYNIDIWFADTQIARAFGKKIVAIEIL